MSGPVLVTTAVLKKPGAQTNLGRVSRRTYAVKSVGAAGLGALLFLAVWWWFAGMGFNPIVPLAGAGLGWWLTTPAATKNLLPGEPLTKYIALRARGIATTMELNGEQAHIEIFPKNAQTPTGSVPIAISNTHVAVIVAGRKFDGTASAYIGTSPVLAPVLGPGKIVWSHRDVGPNVVDEFGVPIRRQQ